VIRRILVAAGIAVAVSCGVAAPASAAHLGGASLQPRADEWWFTTWKILPRVWPLTQGAGVTVAVLDSGVQASIPDLRGAVVPGGDVTGSGTDGETDFASSTDGHGTEMAALIAGQGLGTGMVGIAPQARILPVTVNAGAVDLTADPGRVAAGIMYAANHGAQVIDVSQVNPSGSAAGCDAAEQAAVAYALAKDIVVVAAEGSSNLIGRVPSEPASCNGVLAVAAIQSNRALWPQDVPEPYLTVVAAGAGLVSSGRDGRLVTGVSGARAASALVAGVAALIRSRYPAMPWYQVIQRMIGTALPEGGQVPSDSWGYGIVRLSEVVNTRAFPVPASTPNPVYARYLAWLKTPQGQAVAQQISRESATPRQPAGGHASRVSVGGAVAGSALLLAAATVLLLVARGRRPERRRARLAPRDAMTDPASALAESDPPEPPREESRPRIIFDTAPPTPTTPYRIPPYLLVPDSEADRFGDPGSRQGR
jgi:membrane-anchored mycosin MYCP